MGTRRNGTLFRDVGAQSSQSASRWGLSYTDFLSEWRGTRKFKSIKEMLYNSPVIGALRLSLEMPIQQISWQFVGPEGIDEYLAIKYVAMAL